MSVKKKRIDTGALIASELAASQKPMSAYDLLERLRPTGVFAPTTIYRALEKLLASGKVHRIESMNAFVACRGANDHGHEHGHTDLGTAFTICDGCSAVSELEAPMLRDEIKAVAAANHFRPRSSVVEVHGFCAACAATTASSDLAKA